jgi:oligopeptide transport system substrate-binding protein
MKSHGRRAFLLSAGSAALLTACSKATVSQNRSTPGGGVVYNHGNGAEPASLDPHHTQEAYADTIIGDMLVGLTTEDANSNVIPGAAERWEQTSDGKTWTFYLRDHVWSDGVPVTADDFVFAWRRLLDPKTASPNAYLLYAVKNAEVVNAGKMPGTALGVAAKDAKALVVELEHPIPFMLQLMMHMTAYPVPKHVVEAKGDAWTKPGTYVGNGAYVLAEWESNDHIAVVKNPRFYDAANVKVDRAVFFPTSDYVAALKQFRAGELDTQDRMPAQQINWMRANIPECLHLKPVLTTEYLVASYAVKPLDDPRIREALDLAIDRDTIVNKLNRLGEPAAYNIVPPGTAGYPGGAYFDFRSLPYPQRVKRAQMLMQQAGYGPQNLLRTSLMIRSAAPTARRMPVAIQQMWHQIYVDAQILQLDTAIFYDRVQTGDFEIANAAWGADYNDASSFLDNLRTSNPNNYEHFHNAEYDELLDRAENELDLTARGELMAKAEAIALKQNAWIPILFWVSGALVRPYVKGWVDNIKNTHRTRWISIDEAARNALVAV